MTATAKKQKDTNYVKRTYKVTFATEQTVAIEDPFPHHDFDDLDISYIQNGSTPVAEGFSCYRSGSTLVFKSSNATSTAVLTASVGGIL